MRILLALCLTCLFSVPAAAELRWTVDKNGSLILEVKDKAGLVGYVVKQNGQNGVVEANPVLKKCPKSHKTTFAAAHVAHSHWVLWATCKGDKLFAVQNTTPNGVWESAEGEDYVPPSEDAALIQASTDYVISNLQNSRSVSTLRTGLALAFAFLAFALAAYTVLLTRTALKAQSKQGPDEEE